MATLMLLKDGYGAHARLGAPDIFPSLPTRLTVLPTQQG